MVMQKPEAVFLVGFPGCGKSTFLDSFLASTATQYVILSSDAILMEYAERDNITYAEAHRLFALDLIPVMTERLVALLAEGKNVILDQTHLDPQVRADKLALVPSSYHKIAVVFDVPLDVVRERQMASHRLAVGKFIPSDVMDQMIAVYRKPDLVEFDEIRHITQ